VLEFSLTVSERRVRRVRMPSKVGSSADDTVTGTLKGYDQLLNLVMDDVVEEYESESARLSAVDGGP
jgi:small nuclear ribonucleoprotein (snRNP)-like protein